MAKRPDLTDFTSLVNQTTVVAGLNANNEEIKQAFDNTLSRDGSTPNSMEADLDMNSNRILNLPEPTEDTDPVTKGYGDENYGGAAAARAEAAADSAEGFRDEAEGFRNEAEDFKDAAEVAADRAESAPERFIGTSTTSNTIDVGSKTFTTQEDLFFNPGGFVLIVDAAAPTTNYMHGNIVNYTGTSLQVNVTNTGGSGTLSNWVIAVSGTRGAQGPTGPAGSGAGDLLASNNLSDLDHIPTAVATLGLTIGTNVQAYDALLQAIAALTTSSNKLIKTTGVDTVALIDITTAGQNLLDDADASAQRTTLGLGTAAVATLIDDDTFATATATNVPSAESVKAYVDTEISGISTGGGLINTIYYTCPSQTVTISNASPAVFTYPNSGRDRPQNGCPVRLTTTGSLPPNFSTGVTYYVVNSSGSTSNLAATKGGAAINAGGAGSGTHTIQNAPYDKTINNPSFVRVTVVGGSGGGSTNASQGGGGGGGGAKKLILNADLGTTETVTSGVGGATGVTGGPGGTSSFGSHCSATGGAGGATTPAAGGTGTGGDLNVSGASSAPASTSNATGATSAFGYSRGGNNGAVGQPGIVEVEEYA